MADHYPLLVSDSATPGKPLAVDAPWDGSVIATVDTAGADIVDQALITAHALYRDRDAWIPRPDAAVTERCRASVPGGDRPVPGVRLGAMLNDII